MKNMDIRNSQYLSIGQLQDQYLKQQKTKSIPESLSFSDILQKQQAQEVQADSTVRFSKHASNRLTDRNIELTPTQLERLNDGTRKAGEKGIRESLVIVDKLAFIVNTGSNMVITAMDQTETDENIYTNIDGAVIM